jgi:O-antigen ligase
MLVKTKPNLAKVRMPLAERLMYLAVVFVPFQQALTVQVGFPLKISEVAGLLAVAMMMLEGRKAAFKFHGGGKLALMAVILALSTAANLTRDLPVPNPQGYTRGLTADIIQYMAYAGIVLIVGWFAATRLGPDRIGAGISTAVRLAAIYCAVQAVLFLGGASLILAAVNGKVQSGSAYGLRLPRNGPFLEGNYLGFFAGIAFFIMIRRKDKLGAVLALACLLYSQSTTGILGLLAGLLLIVLLRPTGKIVSLLALLGLVGAVAMTFIPAANAYVAQQLGKLGLVDTEGLSRNIGYSLRSRSVNTDTGFSMMLDNPFLGVGPGRYGAWYSTYTNYVGLPTNFNEGVERAIANNSYVQIFAELGAIAGIAFTLLLAGILWRLRKGQRSDLALAAFLIVGLNATPAWTVLPVWFAIAYLGTATATRTADPPRTKIRKRSTPKNYQHLQRRLERPSAVRMT